MNIIPINEAEAIIQPYYDNGSSTYTLAEHPVMQFYKLTSVDENASFSTTWCSFIIIIKKAAVGRVWAIMERGCNMDISNYDEFILFAAIPKHVLVSVDACIDHQWQTVLTNQPGPDTTGEIRFPFSGTRLIGIRLSFTLAESKLSHVDLRWLGLANQERVRQMESHKSAYSPEWPACLTNAPEEFAPQTRLLFDRQELNTIRKNIKKEPFKSVFERLRTLAGNYLTLDPEFVVTHIHSTPQAPRKPEDMIPENMIGKLVPWGDRRWNMDREMRFSRIEQQMEVLAFVGLVDQNADMCRLAARMALSIAHCEYWTESVMGCLPGTTWHHRSFTEVTYLRACALALDWAGFMLTPHGREIILDAMIMKGLPRVESDFKRQEYIRHMNQGIHFNGGRISAYLTLARYWERYGENIEECRKDLFEMIDNYVLDDGGTLEGPGYWNYTFEEAVVEIYMLAKHAGNPLESDVSEKLKKTAAYGATMLSLQNGGTLMLPVNDCHWDRNFHLGMTATFCMISDAAEWKRLYAQMLKTADIAPDPFWLIVGVKITGLPKDTAPQPYFKSLPQAGQVDSRRADPELGLIHLHYCTGPVYNGHFHGDKGSFILEVADDPLLIDRGVLPYSHPDTMLMTLTSNHNCVCPFSESDEFFTQRKTVEGGVLVEADFQGEQLVVHSDDTNAWEPGLYESCNRKIMSERPRHYRIVDRGRFAKPVKGISFRLHTKREIVETQTGFIIIGDRCQLTITPQNYAPAEKGFQRDGVDSELRSVNVLWFNLPVDGEYAIETELEIQVR